MTRPGNRRTNELRVRDVWNVAALMASDLAGSLIGRRRLRAVLD